MGYTSVRKCVLIEIRTKFNLIRKKEWTGDTISIHTNIDSWTRPACIL
ncbi:MAG: hypothetical protein WA667_24240 [Candidatus Nitrosopolaris sp.]